jgi:hypothetical protein
MVRNRKMKQIPIINPDVLKKRKRGINMAMSITPIMGPKIYQPKAILKNPLNNFISPLSINLFQLIKFVKFRSFYGK